MSWKILRVLLWKEWRQSRSTWLALTLMFNSGVLMFILLITLSESVRISYSNRSIDQIDHMLRSTLMMQSLFVITVGLFLIVYFASKSVSQEVDRQHLFFLFERPIHRYQVLLVKYLAGITQAFISTGSSLFTVAITVLGIVWLLSPDLTLDQVGSSYVDFASHGIRGIPWFGAVSTLIFTATIIEGLRFEREWHNNAMRIGLVTGVCYLVYRIFAWVFPFDRDFSINTYNLDNYAQFQLTPFLVMAAFTAVIYFTAQVLFGRKELT